MKTIIKNIFLISIFAFLIVSFCFNIFSQDAESKFIDAIRKQQDLIPKNFKCKISSDVFTEFFKQLPEDAFINGISDVNLFLIAENGKISIKIEGIKQDYMDFALSYFTIYSQLLEYVFLSSEELSKRLESYTIEFDKDIFILSDDAELISYNFIFIDNLLNTIIFFQGNVKKMEINITYFTYKKYKLVKMINIINFDENGNKKENVILNFSNYKF